MRLTVGKPVVLTTSLALANCLNLLEAITCPVHKYWNSRELAGTIQDDKLTASLKQIGNIGGYVNVEAKLSQLEDGTIVHCMFVITTGMMTVGGLVALAFISGLVWEIWTAQPISEWLSGPVFAWIMLASVILMFASFVPSSFTQRARLIAVLRDVLKARVVEG